MRLLSLRLRNFKGITDFELAPNGANVDVFGDNGVGKTTLADAFMWLLFDKDSGNRKDFEIKTLDDTGEPAHGLDHEVEATLALDGGDAIELRKVYKETWVKKRGSATAEFTGHTTDYFIDGVPVKKADYSARIADIADEETFRLLTDPTFFNVHLRWQDRRALLLHVCGDVTDAEVIASDRALAKLPEILGKRSLDDHRKVIAARRSEINKELDRIPVRIDEATRALPELPGASKSALEAELARQREERQAKDQERVRLESGGEIAEKQRRLNEIESEILVARRRVQQTAHEAVDGRRAEHRRLQREADDRSREARRLGGEAEDADAEAQRITAQMDRVRQAWFEVNGREFEAHSDDTCPTCGQALPADQVEAAHAKALEEFNLRKATQLEAKSAEGKRLKAQLVEIERRRDEARTKADEAANASIDLLERAEALDEQIKRAESQAPSLEADPEYQELVTGKTLLQEGIESLREGNSEALGRLAVDIKTIDGRISALQVELGKFDQRTKGEERIAALKAEERTLAAEFERLESELYLSEQFVRTKVRLLEERINGRFGLVRFKLFRDRINGGVDECCETTVNGVTYASNLNSGARINAGLDIIRILQAHYGVRPPVWIDGCESVTEPLAMDCQTIKLVVSKPDKSLRVEVQNKEVVHVG